MHAQDQPPQQATRCQWRRCEHGVLLSQRATVEEAGLVLGGGAHLKHLSRRLILLDQPVPVNNLQEQQVPSASTASCPIRVGAMRTRRRKQRPLLLSRCTIVEVGLVLGGGVHLHLWCVPLCWQDADEVELAQELAVRCHLMLTLQHKDTHLQLGTPDHPEGGW